MLLIYAYYGAPWSMESGDDVRIHTICKLLSQMDSATAAYNLSQHVNTLSVVRADGATYVAFPRKFYRTVSKLVHWKRSEDLNPLIKLTHYIDELIVAAKLAHHVKCAETLYVFGSMTLFSLFARLYGAKSMIVYDPLSNYAQTLYLRSRRNALELAKYGLYLALHKLQLKASNHIADPQTALGKTLTAAFDALVRELARRADAVTAPGIALAQYARRAGARRVHLVPNGIAEHFLKPHDGRKVRDELGVSDDELLVGYVGSVEFWLDLEPLLKAMSRAKKRKPAKMLIVGKHLQTAYPQKVKETIRRYDLDKNVTWIDFIPHEEVPRYMAAVDLGTIPFNTANPTAWYAAPNKMWEYASQGDTVVSTPIPEAVAHSKALDLRIVESSEDYEKAIMEAEPLTQKQRAETIAQATPLLLKRTWIESTKRFRQVIMQTIKKQP